MKIRVVLVVLVVAAVAGGFYWWLFNPPLPDDVDSTKPTETSSSAASSPKDITAVSSNISSTTGPSAQRLPLNPTGQATRRGTPPSSATITSGVSNSVGSATSQGQVGIATVANGVHFPTPADAITAYAASNLGSISQRRRLPADGLTLDAPLGVYDLYRVLYRGGGLNDVVFSGAYLYPVDSDGQTIDGIAVRSPGPNGLSLYSPPVNYPQISAGLQYLAGLEQVQSGAYEVRFATVTNISDAIWLKSENGGDDLFYTVSASLTPNPRAPVQAGVLYSPNDYLAIILPLVQKDSTRLASPFYTNRGGGGQ
jgi:hypothetical protein